MGLALRPVLGTNLIIGEMGLDLRSVWGTNLLNGETWLALGPVNILH